MSRFIVPVSGIETVPLGHALGRIAALDVVSPIDVPGHDNAAMDGYALRFDDLDPAAPTALLIAGSAFAGKPYTGSVPPGRCVRIMTGAVMPDSCDCVVPQEHTRPGRHDGEVEIPAGQKRGQHRRFAGEDLARGAVAVPCGKRLGPAELGLLASLGCTEVVVRPRLTVAILSTGDELRDPGEPPAPGTIYDSNRFTLAALLERLGARVLDLGRVRDEPDALRAAFERGASEADVLITSGGVSVGEADFTRRLMAELGEVAFWTIAIKPGRPMAFGRIGNAGASAYFFGLPGNPVAVMVTFIALVRDALVRLAGGIPEPVPHLSACCDSRVRKSPGRTEFQRAVAYAAADGWHVRLTGAQGSGILRSMSEANCLIVLPPENAGVEPGDRVEALPFWGVI